jgi:hypothetical protein
LCGDDNAGDAESCSLSASVRIPKPAEAQNVVRRIEVKTA